MSLQVDCEFIESLNGTARGLITARIDGQTVHMARIDCYSAVGRKRFCNTIADKIGNKELEAEIEKQILAALEKFKAEQGSGAARHCAPDSAALLAAMPADVRDFALDKLRSPELIDEIKAAIHSQGVIGDENAGLGVYVSATSRLDKKPTSLIVKAATSAGKSYIISRTARLIPPEQKIEVHHLSPTALLYLPEDALVHKAIFGGERKRQDNPEQQDATKLMREMISDGVLRGCVTEKINGQMVAIPFEKPGP